MTENVTYLLKLVLATCDGKTSIEIAEAVYDKSPTKDERLNVLTALVILKNRGKVVHTTERPFVWSLA